MYENANQAHSYLHAYIVGYLNENVFSQCLPFYYRKEQVVTFQVHMK